MPVHKFVISPRGPPKAVERTTRSSLVLHQVEIMPVRQDGKIMVNVQQDFTISYDPQVISLGLALK